VLGKQKKKRSNSPLWYDQV